MEHIKNISTAHAHAQANLVGKLPNRSLWGVFIPAGDLLHCALPGPFLSTLHTDLRHTLSARLLYLCSARSEGKKAGSPCFTSASGGSWPLTRVCVWCVFRQSSQEAAPGASLVVQWLRLQAPNAGGQASVPGQGTGSYVHAALKSSHVTLGASTTELIHFEKKKTPLRESSQNPPALVISVSPLLQNLPFLGKQLKKKKKDSVFFKEMPQLSISDLYSPLLFFFFFWLHFPKSLGMNCGQGSIAASQEF